MAFEIKYTLLKEFLPVVVLDLSRCLLPRFAQSPLQVACICDVSFVEARFDYVDSNSEFATLSSAFERKKNR